MAFKVLLRRINKIVLDLQKKKQSKEEKMIPLNRIKWYSVGMCVIMKICYNDNETNEAFQATSGIIEAEPNYFV